MKATITAHEFNIHIINVIFSIVLSCCQGLPGPPGPPGEGGKPGDQVSFLFKYSLTETSNNVFSIISTSLPVKNT